MQLIYQPNSTKLNEHEGISERYVLEITAEIQLINLLIRYSQSNSYSVFVFRFSLFFRFCAVR